MIFAVQPLASLGCRERTILRRKCFAVVVDRLQLAGNLAQRPSDNLLVRCKRAPAPLDCPSRK
jgi:hypothetical protein